MIAKNRDPFANKSEHDRAVYERASNVNDALGEKGRVVPLPIQSTQGSTDDLDEMWDNMPV